MGSYRFLEFIIQIEYRYFDWDCDSEWYKRNLYNLHFFAESWIKKMEEYTPWFKEQENIKADESLRPGKPTNYDELFGIDGSFRQLVIDWSVGPSTERKKTILRK